jgi:8-oxo-dGTP pyrophosphatase MutT (NUDIX family)
MASSAEIGSLLGQRLREYPRHTLSIEGFRKAAVLVPVIVAGEKPTLLFTKRTDSVETHKGQISFPGGLVEGTDSDPVETALRETYEEVGIPPQTIIPLGILDDIATPIGFVITPVVGLLQSRPEITLSHTEVAEAFEMPLSFFRNPLNGRRELREVNGRQYEIWHYDTGKHVIWGATAKIVRLLLDKLDEAQGTIAAG